MSHLLLTHQNFNPNFTPRAARHGLPALRLNLGPISALVLMMVLVGLLGLVSLTHLNAQSTKGYQINQLEDEHEDLVSDREINDMLILQARSMKSVEEYPRVQAMVKPTTVYYLDSLTGLAQTDTP